MKKSYYQDGKQIATIEKLKNHNGFHVSISGNYYGLFPDIETAESRIFEQFPGAKNGENITVDSIVDLINKSINNITISDNDKINLANNEFALGRIMALLDVLEIYDKDVFCEMYNDFRNDINAIMDKTTKYIANR